MGQCLRPRPPASSLWTCLTTRTCGGNAKVAPNHRWLTGTSTTSDTLCQETRAISLFSNARLFRGNCLQREASRDQLSAVWCNDSIHGSIQSGQSSDDGDAALHSVTRVMLHASVRPRYSVIDHGPIAPSSVSVRAFRLRSHGGYPTMAGL
ncbi:hypothetical protein LX36DRAFT_63377 [Colletotrichum falcatum]|nr:hypothetical protein LX36DRAFT_63377 [Colletotrichum falcatum]